MKNKLFVFGLLVFFAATLTFTSCGDNAQPVKEVKVTDVKFDNIPFFEISWDAVGTNVDGYIIYIQMKDKKTITDVTETIKYFFEMSYGHSIKTALFVEMHGDFYLYATEYNSFQADKWFAYLPAILGDMAGEYYIGVRSVVNNGHSDYSNITWTKDTYTFKKTP